MWHLERLRYKLTEQQKCCNGKLFSFVLSTHVGDHAEVSIRGMRSPFQAGILHNSDALLVLQAANPELSMSQIQQLTALAFARDDPEQAVQPPAPAPASPSDASHNDGPSASEVQAEPATGPSPPVSGQAGPSGTVASETPAGGAGPPGSGSSAAAAAADFAHARSDGSEWASGFIAEARAQNEASSDALTSLSGAPISPLCPRLHLPAYSSMIACGSVHTPTFGYLSVAGPDTELLLL